jgi:hypothetical protein
MQITDPEVLEALKDTVSAIINKGPVMVEMSNPGSIGEDTGHEFVSKRTGQRIRVIAKVGESHSDAIERVERNHGNR